MEINRNNYEEYFLLYADNELTDYEKIEVLKFIRENKDLEDEFRMIQDTICKPDNVLMENKANLLRSNEVDLITDKNYEEIFVLYHDGELNDQEKSKTELFVSLNPHFKKEFDVTGIAKLLPDNSISFPGKKDLYKREKAGRVIPLIFWRSVAVAVFIGFGLWIFEAYHQQPSKLPGIVKNVNPIKKTEPTSPKNISENKPAESTIAKADNQNSIVAEKKKSAYKREVVKHNAKVEEDEPSFVQATIRNTSKVDYNKDASVEKLQPDVAVNKIKNIPQKNAIENNDITGDIEVKPLQKDNSEVQSLTQAQPTSYVDANQKNENYVFYNITTEKFGKSKVGGFLKKVKRIVERNNPVSRIFSGEEKQVASN